VSLADYVVAGRYSIPGIDAAFAVDGTPMVFAFGHGLECELGPEGRTIGRPTDTARLLSPVVTPGAVYGIAARRAPRRPGNADPASATGFVLRIDPRTRSVVARRPLAKARRLLGVDAVGRLVAVTDRELVLLDPESLAPAARLAVGHAIARSALAGPSTAVVAEAKRGCRELSVIECDADLARPTRKTKPIAPARIPTTVAVSGRNVEINQQYDNARLELSPPYERREPPEFVVGGRDFRRCDFYSCTINCLFRGQRAHYLVRDVTLEGCRLSRCAASNVTFEDCVLDKPKVSGQLQLTGCLFKHVVIRGNPGLLCIYDYYKSDITETDRQLRRTARDAYYRGVDWAIDIREAETEEVRTRNVPLELVRRDPRRTLLVWTKHQDHPVWQSPARAHGLWRTDVADAASDGCEAILLSPLRKPKHQAEYAAAERALRDAGLVDDVTGVR
jgi:hypothetical protein